MCGVWVPSLPLTVTTQLAVFRPSWRALCLSHLKLIPWSPIRVTELSCPQGQPGDRTGWCPLHRSNPERRNPGMRPSTWRASAPGYFHYDSMCWFGWVFSFFVVKYLQLYSRVATTAQRVLGAPHSVPQTITFTLTAQG